MNIQFGCSRTPRFGDVIPDSPASNAVPLFNRAKSEWQSAGNAGSPDTYYRNAAKASQTMAEGLASLAQDVAEIRKRQR